MYLRMNVGRYKGEIRGPFHHEAAKALIERKDATLAESIGDGRFRAVDEPVVEEVSQQQESEPVAEVVAVKPVKKGRK
jgi:hypothetical protein